MGTDHVERKRFRVTLLIDVDPEAYRTEYGEPRATQRDIRDYIEGAAQSAVTDALTTIEARVAVDIR